MKVTKLTKIVVTDLKPGDKPYVAWCGKEAGFGVSVRPTGSKSFIAQYDFGGRRGVTRRVTIGKFGKPWTVDQARTEAEAILNDAKRGIDFAETKAKRKAELTVAELCDEYLEEGCEHKKSTTVKNDKGRIERHIKQHSLGGMKISDVRSFHIEKFLRDVAKGKTAADSNDDHSLQPKKRGRIIVTGGKGAATRTVRLLGGIFTYALKRNYISENPRKGVEVYADKKGKRYLSPDEFSRLGEAMQLAETEGLPWKFNEGAQSKHRPKDSKNQREVISPYAIAAIRLLMLTGCRLSEILKLRWNEVNFERGLLELSDSKTGAKDVLLGAAALKLLADLPRVEGNPHVIVGEVEGKPRSDLKRPWKRIVSYAGLDATQDRPSLRIHDLRHSFASVGVASGMSLPIVGKLLGHASTITTQRYAHIAENAERRGLDAIEATIAAQTGMTKSGEVVPIKKGQANDR